MLLFQAQKGDVVVFYCVNFGKVTRPLLTRNSLTALSFAYKLCPVFNLITCSNTNNNNNNCNTLIIIIIILYSGVEWSGVLALFSKMRNGARRPFIMNVDGVVFSLSLPFTSRPPANKKLLPAYLPACLPACSFVVSLPFPSEIYDYKSDSISHNLNRPTDRRLAAAAAVVVMNDT